MDAGVTFLVVALCFSAAQCAYHKASVYCKKSSCTYKLGVLDVKGATAYGSYNDTLEQTGWGILNIKAGYGADKTDNTNIMFAAGYIESLLTQMRIYQNYQNMINYFTTELHIKNGTIDAGVRQFFMDQDQYMREKIDKLAPTCPYWRHVSYILAQYDGLIKGYADVAPYDQKLSLYSLQLLNGDGDLPAIIRSLHPETIPNWENMSKDEFMSHVAKSGRCSALIKVLGAYEDVFLSHSTWYTYQSTMRIYKHYDFNVDDQNTNCKRISMPSYPGIISSLDDFYLLGSKMTMFSTTNDIYNKSLYKLIKPQSLLAWHRVRVANMMAVNGTQWGEIVAAENSGTYNNQYMILDLNKIVLNKEIQDNALTIIEQIPGFVQQADTTNILRTGYWPSYNVPYFEKIYKMSGYPDVVKQKGVDFSYQLAPRAKIFRRDEGTVKDLATMKQLMRYNNYTEDPYSEGDSYKSICGRGDLQKSRDTMGCYDTKVSSYKMASEMAADIVSGPTRSSGLQAFQWSDSYTQSHVGLPQVYNFDFLRTKPGLPDPLTNNKHDLP